MDLYAPSVFFYVGESSVNVQLGKTGTHARNACLTRSGSFLVRLGLLALPRL